MTCRDPCRFGVPPLRLSISGLLPIGIYYFDCDFRKIFSVPSLETVGVVCPLYDGLLVGCKMVFNSIVQLGLNMFKVNGFGMMFIAVPSNICSLDIVHWSGVLIDKHSVLLQKGQYRGFEIPDIVKAWHADPHRKMYFVVRCYDIIKMLCNFFFCPMF